MPLSAAELSRYRRHLALPQIGVAGQEKLRAARVLVIGAGGLGSPASLYLTAAGIGTLGLVDCDRVDLSNMQRQVLFDTASVGRPKAAAARERLLRLNPQITVVAHALELAAANAGDLFGAYDLVVDGSDRLSTRYLVNDACVIFAKPLVTAAIHQFEGQAMTYLPGRGPCYRCLYEDAADAVVETCAEGGVLGALPGILGAVQAAEAIKIVLGVGEPLVGRLLTFDALEMRFREFPFARRSDCAVCGDRPTITAPRDAEAACRPADLPGLQRLSAMELRALLDDPASADTLRLVDVREPREFAGGHLDLAVNIPVADLPSRLHEIAPWMQPVFICRSGSRSLTACAIALRAGVAAPSHLEGGLLAWVEAVDSALPLGGYSPVLPTNRLSCSWTLSAARA